MSTRSRPVRVLHLWEALVDLVHGHEFLLATSAVRAGVDRLHGDGVDVLAAREGTVARVVAETVFYSYNNPAAC